MSALDGRTPRGAVRARHPHSYCHWRYVDCRKNDRVEWVVRLCGMSIAGSGATERISARDALDPIFARGPTAASAWRAAAQMLKAAA